MSAPSVAVVSGAAQGIGRATAVAMARSGATVYCGDIKDCGVTLKEIEAEGGRAVALELDVRRADDWTRFVEQVVAESGRIDYLANIAGIVNLQSPDDVVNLTEEAWDDVLNTNLKGVWMGMRAVIPTMQSQGGGRIVSIASMAALRGLVNLASYTAAKGGVAALTRQAAVEYGPDNILINAICPGTIDTPILGDITEEMRTQNANAHIVRRLGRPEEVAAMVRYFFLEGSFLTGEVYPVDGGWSASGG